MTSVVRLCVRRCQRLLHGQLAFRIERAGRLVEQQDGRIAQDGAGERDALALAAGQRHAALAEPRCVALRPGRAMKPSAWAASAARSTSASLASGRP